MNFRKYGSLAVMDRMCDLCLEREVYAGQRFPEDHHKTGRQVLKKKNLDETLIVRLLVLGRVREPHNINAELKP